MTPAAAANAHADALAELARRGLEAGHLPQVGGDPPQLTVTVDLDSLLGPPAASGEVGGAGPPDPQACQRLACDAAVTRVLVTRPAHRHHRPPARPRGHPPPQPEPERDPRADRPAVGRHGPAPPGPGWGAHPAAGGRPDQPGRPNRPTQRPGRPRRRLRLPRLRPPPSLVRSPPSTPLAAWRPHRPGQPRPGVPSPPPRRPRRRLATGPPPRRPPHRHPTPPTTSRRPTTPQCRLNRPAGELHAPSTAEQ